jgi:Flp pilus assembly pilin Flp
MIRKTIGACKALLLDENGQTMLEYVVIVVFVVIVMFFCWRMVGPLVQRSVQRASVSIEQ